MNRPPVVESAICLLLLELSSAMNMIERQLTQEVTKAYKILIFAVCLKQFT